MTFPRRVRVLGDLYHGRIPTGAVYVDRAVPGLRASRYATPHRVGARRRCGQEQDQADAVAAYAADLDRQPDLVVAVPRNLDDVEVACWCRQSVLACHEADSGHCDGQPRGMLLRGCPGCRYRRRC